MNRYAKKSTRNSSKRNKARAVRIARKCKAWKRE